MLHREPAPYGTWASPITSDLIVSRTVRLGSILLDCGDIYWLEGRPAEGGRYAIVKRSRDGRAVDLLPAPFNARTRVHEYGGGAFTAHNGIIYFSNYQDQRLYRLSPDELPLPLTTTAPLRYADGVADVNRNRIICVREDHSKESYATNQGQPVNTITAISLTDGTQQVLIAGNDFYAAPRLSPDGHRLAWLTWNHPNMPWDGTELWVADLDDAGRCANARLVAGGTAESICQPTWSPDGILTFVSDRSGWWNLYRWENGAVRCLLEMEAEFGRPQWAFGMSTYAYLSSSQIICTYSQEGYDHLARLDVRSGQLIPIDVPYTSIDSVVANENQVVFCGATPTTTHAIVALDAKTWSSHELRHAAELELDTGYLSLPQALTFATENGQVAHGFYYAPKNKDFIPPQGEKPPLLVLSHGGPTGATSSALNLQIQYWTSRGFAVLDVNYRGSTGYGRAYREQLLEQWGIADVDDCVNGARHLVAKGLADGQRLAIRGGSAGGYTTLSALTFRNTFHAGAVYYGIGDLEALTRDTHKFESHYLDRLIGRYPEQRERYLERSPIHHVTQLNCPVIFFQGLEDKVVPPAQAETMVAALRRKRLPVAYLAFAGEQHGFRRAENIKRALDAELYFYGKVLGFTPADPLEPITIDNLDLWVTTRAHDDA